MKTLTLITLFSFILLSCGGNSNDQLAVISTPTKSLPTEEALVDLNDYIDHSNITCESNAICTPDVTDSIILNGDLDSALTISEDGMSLINNSDTTLDISIETLPITTINLHLERVTIHDDLEETTIDSLSEGFLMNSTCPGIRSGIVVLLPQDTKLVTIPSINGFKNSNGLSGISVSVRSLTGEVIKSVAMPKEIIISNIPDAKFLVLELETGIACKEINFSSLNIKTLSY